MAGQASGDPVCRVIVLTENDSAVLEPVPLLEEVNAGIELRISWPPFEVGDHRHKVEHFLVEDVRNFGIYIEKFVELVFGVSVSDAAVLNQSPAGGQSGCDA